MQKLRPYVLPGLFVFHLITVCVLLTTVSGRNDPSATAAYVTIVSQFFLTALFAGLGPGPWALRIPGWGALAGLSWIGFVFFLRHQLYRLNNENLWSVPSIPVIIWIALVALLLLLRVIPFLKWRVALQSALPSTHVRKDSVTRGILAVVAAWGGVLVLLKDSWPWSEFIAEFRQPPRDLLFASGIATIVGAVALVVTVLAVGLTLTRLADWMFYRRRWTLPLLVIVTTGAAVGLLLSFGGPFRSGSERLLAALWLLLGLATQPLTTLLVMGLAGYRLAPRKSPEPHASEPASDTPQPTTTERAENWLFRLQRVQFAAPITVLVFLGWIGMTGLGNDHFVSVFLGQVKRTDAGEIRHLAANSSVTDGRLVHLKELRNLESLDLSSTRVTDAGLVHLKGLTNLQELTLDRTQVTDTGLVHLTRLNNLETLWLPIFVTDAGLVHLKGLTNLKDLTLHGMRGTDAGLVHLKGMTNLQVLNLSFTQITDAGLVHLKGLTNLKELDLQVTQITDAGLVHLKGLTRLQSLDLFSNFQITDSGLVHIKGLTNLKQLNLGSAFSKSEITDAGVAELQKALPNCEIPR